MARNINKYDRFFTTETLKIKVLIQLLMYNNDTFNTSL